ncbi:hypothetical protein H1V43_26735 [Streptomyces sp. PSKA54]|uniref:Uncharacterized protein n=1 Tax=Streptomyces himalayensis subsp. aureolus TaxID=2758039 RepID=A0A7W2D4Z9_9ACTN|nr:hypothetical protein [Streptomyces himalayensis]MBA4864882.1 hypothetical protein [Streptomyces himalayensis subsp. aureolus]
MTPNQDHRAPANSGPRPTVDDVTHCVEELRDALAVHGITLPSLCADLPTFAGTYAPPAGLVALGNCNTATARQLTAALRKAAVQ